MTPIDRLWILQPLLIVVIAYPLLGVVLFLACRTRLRRLAQSRLPAASGTEHTDLGRALAAAVVAITLLALVVVISSKAPLPAFAAVPARLSLLALVALFDDLGSGEGGERGAPVGFLQTPQTYRNADPVMRNLALERWLMRDAESFHRWIEPCREKSAC